MPAEETAEEKKQKKQKKKKSANPYRGSRRDGMPQLNGSGNRPVTGTRSHDDAQLATQHIKMLRAPRQS